MYQSLTDGATAVVDDQHDLEVLVTSAAAGTQDAWDELVERFSPLLVSVLLRSGMTGAELQDVAQTVWLRLIEHLGSIRDPRALPGWLVTTARREAIRVSRAARRVQPRDPSDESWAAVPTPEVDPGMALERSEREAALLEGFAMLNARQRQVLLLLAQDPPVPYSQISRRTGVPVGSIGPTRARALDRLRRTPSVQTMLTGVGVEPSGGDPRE